MMYQKEIFLSRSTWTAPDFSFSKKQESLKFKTSKSQAFRKPNILLENLLAKFTHFFITPRLFTQLSN